MSEEQAGTGRRGPLRRILARGEARGEAPGDEGTRGAAEDEAGPAPELDAGAAPEAPPATPPQARPATPPPAATLDELRRDVAALWLAFTQHETVLREIRTELTRLGGRPVRAPGDRERPDSFEGAGAGDVAAGSEPGARQDYVPRSSEAPAVEPLADAVGEQLADLDDVLAAIERATRSLEQAHRAEIEGKAPERGEPPADRPAP